MEEIKPTLSNTPLPPDVRQSYYLIFEAREKLTKLLNEKNMLSLVPFSKDYNVVDLGSQMYIREIIGNITEELFEAQVELEKDTTIQFTGSSKNLELREELADVHHFFLELFLYTKVSIHSLTSQLISDTIYLNCNSGLDQEDKLDIPFVALRRAAMRLNQQTYGVSPSIKGRIDSYRVSRPKIQEYYFNILKNLNELRFMLKNKPWKHVLYAPDLKEVGSRVMDAYIHFIMLYEFLGLGEHIVHDFLVKNIINFKRANG